MKQNGGYKYLLYAVMLIAMLFSALQLTEPTVEAGVCCTFGNQCEGHSICCAPPDGAAPCSEAQKNYCLVACQ